MFFLFHLEPGIFNNSAKSFIDVHLDYELAKMTPLYIIEKGREKKEGQQQLDLH